jgi:DNA-binding NarL/FixJ family response regulator
MGVLLADDKAWLRSALRLLLEHEANIEVLGEAGNARVLAQLMTKLRPDLLFLDWQLPGLNTNGSRQQLIQSMRAAQPDLFIIALTTDENAQSCLRWGVDASINKAEPPDRILAVVRQAMSKLSQIHGNNAQSHRLL